MDSIRNLAGMGRAGRSAAARDGFEALSVDEKLGALFAVLLDHTDQLTGMAETLDGVGTTLADHGDALERIERGQR